MLKLLFRLFLIVKLSTSQRRITNSSGLDYNADTSFVVYILKSEEEGYEGWMCGGAIIHPSLILTSASCLEVGSQEMYVITGYSKYVPLHKHKDDPCMNTAKQKIISYCKHRDYAKSTEPEFTPDELKYRWTKFDIAVARTQYPIDFYDNRYLTHCSYLPTAVGINYNSKYEESPANVVVYGWGHTTYYRPEGDTKDYNQREIRYASSIVLPRVECTSFYENVYMKDRVGNSFICTNGAAGELNSRGFHVVHSQPVMEKCDNYVRRTGTRGNNTVCSSGSNLNETNPKNETDDLELGNTRRHGICQNDHGNPLVLWIGGHPFVVGVGSAFLVNKKMECVGPYLYTSVSCTSQFIHCVLREQTTLKLRRSPSICDSSEERGFIIDNIDINWSDDDF